MTKEEALANEALDKMAENARELGLDYEPPQRTWVGLTEDEADKIYKDGNTFGEMMRMVEAKLKEKNS